MVYLKPRDTNSLTSIPASESTTPGTYGIGRQKNPKWGVQQCPVIYSNAVIVAPLSESTAVVAFEKNTGRLLWKSPPAGKGSFTHQTPLLATVAGTNQVILCSNEHDGPPAFITGFSADTGDKLWQRRIAKYNIPIPSPVAIDDRRIFVAGGYTVGCFMLSIRQLDGRMAPDVPFANKNCTPMIQTPVLFRNRIYASSYDEFHKTSAPNRGFACYDLDGNVLWETGSERHFDQGGFIMTSSGLVFIMHARTGFLHLLAVSPSGWNELASAKIFDDAPSGMRARWWSPLALSDGKLLARNDATMVCLDVGRNRQ